MSQSEAKTDLLQEIDSPIAESCHVTGASASQRSQWLPQSPRAIAKPWSTILRYARTIRHLEPVQILTRFRRRPSARSVTKVARLRMVPGKWLQPIPRSRAQTGPNRFRFLNEEREIATWNDKSIPKLWLYNLHYYEHVDQPLVERWIAENPVGQGIGWDPYPTSLRIANWCKWILDGARANSFIYDSIATQAAWLEKSLETHLLANHLLANAKALLFAGSILECADSERWCRIALQLYEKELPRQIVSDGAHVERSPIYHSIVLEDLLDASNLAHALNRHIPQLSYYVSPMLRWLDQMTHPDGEIAFFNDAAFGIAPDRCALQAYARRLGFHSAGLSLGDSGYVRLENEIVVVIFDAAVLGPDYQPGHGHADALSFELSNRGQRVLVNSGTSTYESNSIRAFERGTAAHNTVRIDGVDQSEMWAAFRVARRARPYDLYTDHHSFAEAAHDGYHRLSPKVTHRRRIDLRENLVTITDRLEGCGYHSAEVFFHLAPAANPELKLDPKLRSFVSSATFSTGWNERISNRVVIGRWSGRCPVEFVSRINLA